MLNNKKTISIALTFLVSLTSLAQTTAPDISPQNGFMRSEGKIYVVMVVVITILAGLILYVLRLDKKLTRLEKGEDF